MLNKERIEFNVKIIRLIENGFLAEDKNKYRIMFEDKKFKHFFKPSDEVVIVIENVEEARDEEVKEGYSVIYCILQSYLSNGIHFLGINEKHGFFWNFRGQITSHLMENHDYWSKGEILRIMIHSVTA